MSRSRRRNNRNPLASVMGILLIVLLLPVLVVNVTLIAKSLTRPDEVPSFMGYKPLIVLSGSMEPVIQAGDLIITRQVPAETLGQGDIIAYRYGEAVITHRIEGVEEQAGALQFITKGDANNVQDQRPVTPELVEGKYLLRIPGMGSVALFLQTPLGLVLIVLGPVALYMLYDALHRRRQLNRQMQRSAQLEEELIRLKSRMDIQDNGGKENQETIP